MANKTAYFLTFNDFNEFDMTLER